MSIVISAIEKNRKLYIISDRRGIKKGVVRDDYQKIYQLAPGIYFGMTGIHETGLEFFDFIKEYASNDKYRLIRDIRESFDSFFSTKAKPEKFSIVIAGRDNSGKFFIWQRNIQGKDIIVEGSNENIDFAINTNDERNIFGDYLRELIISGLNVRDAIIRTIEYASEIDSSISKKYQSYEI